MLLFSFLFLLLHFSSTWHNGWRTAFIIWKDFYFSLISQNIPSGDNPFSSVCSLVYRLKVENDKLIWREARSLAFEFYYLIVCPCTNCSAQWENSLSKLVIMMFGKQGELWDKWLSKNCLRNCKCKGLYKITRSYSCGIIMPKICFVCNRIY